MSLKFIYIATSSSLLLSLAPPLFSENARPETQPDQPGYIALHYSDGSVPALGLDAVNKSLSEIGVRVSQVEIPEKAKPIVKASRSRALTEMESDALIQHFHLGRRDLVEEILKAGRRPEMHRGGYMNTSETGVSPYPKVYDMKALNLKTTIYLQEKFGKLHVNSSEAGVGIDEVMTIVSGGPYTWFFTLKKNVVGKLKFGTVDEISKAWRISYPGIVPHGGYFDAPNGLVVAFAHGPRHFVMRYEDPSVDGFQTLGGNPWIDFTTGRPTLLSKPKASPVIVSKARQQFNDFHYLTLSNSHNSMISTQSILEDRVTTGRFDPSFSISDEDIHELVRLATKAPSAFNLQNWYFIAVRSQSEKEKLQSVSFGQRQITEAAVTFIVCGLTNAYNTLFETLQPSVDAGLLTPSLQRTWSEMASASHESNPQLQRDEAIRSATFAAMCLLVAVEEMGLASGVLGGFEPDKLQRQFRLKSDQIPVMLVTIGKRGEGNWPSKIRKPVEQVLKYL